MARHFATSADQVLGVSRDDFSQKAAALRFVGGEVSGIAVPTVRCRDDLQQPGGSPRFHSSRWQLTGGQSHVERVKAD
ncbi:hypothetical protein ACVIU7_009405 [Bradyrhizobium liaoningense]